MPLYAGRGRQRVSCAASISLEPSNDASCPPRPADAAVPLHSITLANVTTRAPCPRSRSRFQHPRRSAVPARPGKCHDGRARPRRHRRHRGPRPRPARVTRIFGQLERQNREHRAWLDRVGPLAAACLADELERMRVALNASWPRRTLGWQTAEERWNQRPLLSIDRDALRAEVTDLARSLRPATSAPLNPRCPAWRRAIELTLSRHGLLIKLSRGDCYDNSNV